MFLLKTVAGRLLTLQHTMTIPALKSFISSLILQEINRFKRETGSKPVSWKDKFAKYAEEGKSNNNLFVHFSNYPKLGLYLRNEYRTPIGFYSYLLHPDKIEDFAIDRAYAIIFRAKPEAKILSNSLSEEELKGDVTKLVRRFGHYAKEVAANVPTSAWYDQYVGTDGRWFAFLWSVTRTLSGADSRKYDYKDGSQKGRGGGPTARWSYILWKMLGYDGVIDDGYSIIHDQEPHQALFFDTTKLEVLEIIHLGGDENRSKADLFRRELNFSGLDLRDNFREKLGLDVGYGKTRLFNANFSKSNLSNVYVGDLFIPRGIFAFANLEGATFSYARLKNSVFVGAFAEKAVFEGANLVGCRFEKAKLNGANFYGADITGCSFNGADLRNANFSRLHSAVGAIFKGADLRSADLSSFEFMTSIDLRGARYDNTTKFPDFEDFDPNSRGLIKVGD